MLFAIKFNRKVDKLIMNRQTMHNPAHAAPSKLEPGINTAANHIRFLTDPPAAS